MKIKSPFLGLLKCRCFFRQNFKYIMLGKTLKIRLYYTFVVCGRILISFFKVFKVIQKVFFEYYQSFFFKFKNLEKSKYKVVSSESKFSLCLINIIYQS